MTLQRAEAPNNDGDDDDDDDDDNDNNNKYNVTKGFKEKFGSHKRKTFNRFSTKDSYTWNVTHNTESTAV
jgi:hypothetical protein